MTAAMIELVAKALFDQIARSLGHDMAKWEGVSDEVRALFMRDARATIEAMREPSDAMIRAALEARKKWLNGDAPTTTVWRTMIDAALRDD